MIQLIKLHTLKKIALIYTVYIFLRILTELGKYAVSLKVLCGNFSQKAPSAYKWVIIIK